MLSEPYAEMYAKAMCRKRGAEEDMQILVAAHSDTRLPREDKVSITRLLVYHFPFVIAIWSRFNPVLAIYFINPSCTYREITVNSKGFTLT